MATHLPDHEVLFPEVGIYVHFPFCARKCSYCDFPSFAGQDDQMAAYIAALHREIAAAPRLAVRSVFLGGGTPSYLPGPWMAEIVAHLYDHFAIAPDAEFTMEANPGNERLTDGEAGLAWADYRAMGINRISLGVQTFDARLLQALGRIHSPADALAAVAAVKKAEFPALSIDLMYGLPQQTVAEWAATLDVAIGLDLPHLSAYSLIVEPHTPFEMQERLGLLALPTEDAEREMADLADERLTAAGYQHYEISNWAQPGFESRHNQVYWRNEPWLGLGSGAHSYYRRRRWANPVSISGYVANGPTPPPEEPQSLVTEQEETMFMGLRLTREGVEEARFRRRFGLGLAERYGPIIERLKAADLVDWTEDRLVLSRHGLPLANEAFASFIA